MQSNALLRRPCSSFSAGVGHSQLRCELGINCSSLHQTYLRSTFEIAFIVHGMQGPKQQQLPSGYHGCSKPVHSLPCMCACCLPFTTYVSSAACTTRPALLCRPCRVPGVLQPHLSSRFVRLQQVRAADAGTLGDMGAPEEPPYEYKPFSRLRERNPHRWDC